MDGVRLISQKFLASALICVLALMSAMSVVCPAGDRMDQAASQHFGLLRPTSNATDTCGKDGCSCCGFHLVAPQVPPILAQGDFVASVTMCEVLPPAEPIFDLNYPPRL
jgi:hypothetical protein